MEDYNYKLCVVIYCYQKLQSDPVVYFGICTTFQETLKINWWKKVETAKGLLLFLKLEYLKRICILSEKISFSYNIFSFFKKPSFGL